jgi:uncharacterized Zn finger protein (UPF0148 family)
MFDETLRRLRQMGNGIRIPLSLPLDDDGYLDRSCHSEECEAEFKVLFQDWKSRVKDEIVYCPICRHEAPATEWNTLEQLRYIKQVALNRAKTILGDALRTDAERFNRGQPSRGFLRMSMTYKPGAPTFMLPIQAAEMMQQRFACEKCGCRYASIGAAFFCPACGHNSAVTTFGSAVAAVRQQVESIASISDAVRRSAGPDAAEDTVRHLLENALVKLAGSFQRLAEAKFASLPQCADAKYRRNVFQNIPESSELWRRLTGRGYDDMVSKAEFAAISRLFQVRHLLSHREGIVDQDYVDRTGDTRYAVGQRVIVREQTVIEMAGLVTKLAAVLPSAEDPKPRMVLP